MENKYLLTLRFEANPSVEAGSLEEALAKGQEMIDKCIVTSGDESLVRGEDFWAMEPAVLEMNGGDL